MSEMRQNWEEQLQRYLEGQMSACDEQTFLMEIRHDPILMNEVRAQVLLIRAIYKEQERNSQTMKAAQTIKREQLDSLLEGLKQMSQDEHLIEHYMEDRLTPEEQARYEQRKNETDFQQTARRVALMREAITQVQEKNRQVLAEAGSVSKEELLAALNGDRHVSQPKNEVHLSTWIKYRRWAGMAAAVLLAAGLSVDYYFASEARGLATASLTYASATLNETGLSRSDVAVGEKIQGLIDQLDQPGQRNDAVLALENLYQKASDDMADVEDAYVEQISLSLVTGYIRQGERAKAKRVLQALLKDPMTSESTRSQAERLLSALSRTYLF